MSQIAHEMGHRWSAFVSAKVNGETIPLGPTHWARGLQARVVFPYQRPTEASNMGGGVWQDNFDGTFTQLDDNYYVPATGYSYLDLTYGPDHAGRSALILPPEKSRSRRGEMPMGTRYSRPIESK